MNRFESDLALIRSSLDVERLMKLRAKKRMLKAPKGIAKYVPGTEDFVYYTTRVKRSYSKHLTRLKQKQKAYSNTRLSKPRTIYRALVKEHWDSDAPVQVRPNVGKKHISKEQIKTYFGEITS